MSEKQRRLVEGIARRLIRLRELSSDPIREPLANISASAIAALAGVTGDPHAR